MIELEMFLVFYTAIFFTLLYVIKKELLFGIITFGGWITLGGMWLLISPMDTAISIALFFHIIGILFLISVVVQYLRQLDVSKGHGDDED